VNAEECPDHRVVGVQTGSEGKQRAYCTSCWTFWEIGEPAIAAAEKLGAPPLRDWRVVFADLIKPAAMPGA